MARIGPVDAAELAKAPRSEWERRIAALAERQHGIVAHRQLRALGLSPATIRSRAARGLLHPLHHGVYALAYRPLRAQAHWLAAVIACGSGAVISHATAAMAWGIRRSLSSSIDVTAPGRGGRRRPGLRVHSAARLRPASVDLIDGVPVTTVARTLIDLAGMVRESAAEYAVHRAQVKGILDRAPLDG